MSVYEQIRKAHEREGLSVRSLARRFHVHRRDVRQALASAVPPPAKRPRPRPHPRSTPGSRLSKPELEEAKKPRGNNAIAPGGSGSACAKSTAPT